MQNEKAPIRTSNPAPVLLPALAVASVLLAAGTIMIAAPRAAQAMPQFATQTGLPCGQCHADMSAPSKLTDFGQAFHANGDKVPTKK